jgi:hypothetical protein
MMVEGFENRANIMKHVTRGTSGGVSDVRLFQERVFGAYPDRDFRCFGATWLIGGAVLGPLDFEGVRNSHK